MVLLIDIGNSNVVAGVYGGEKKFVSRLSTVKERTGDEWAVFLKAIFELNGLNPAGIEGAMISSVVPPITGHLCAAVSAVCGKTPLLVGPGIKTGLEILIDNPAQLGSDMVCSAVAAMDMFKKPVLICDLGTATKISAINRKGQFVGCAIIPGVQTALDALSRGAAQLQHIAIEAPARVVGKNTVESMQSGVVFGAAAMIDGMVLRMEEELGAKCTLVATGGLCGEICRHVRHELTIDPELVLKGLHILYLKNTQRV